MVFDQILPLNSKVSFCLKSGFSALSSYTGEEQKLTKCFFALTKFSFHFKRLKMNENPFGSIHAKEHAQYVLLKF